MNLKAQCRGCVFIVLVAHIHTLHVHADGTHVTPTTSTTIKDVHTNGQGQKGNTEEQQDGRTESHRSNDKTVNHHNGQNQDQRSKVKHIEHHDGQNEGQRPKVNAVERLDDQNGDQRPKFTAKNYISAERFIERLIQRDEDESSPNKHGNHSLETIWKSDVAVEIFLEKLMQKVQNKSSHTKHRKLTNRHKRNHSFGPRWLRMPKKQSKVFKTKLHTKRDSIPQIVRRNVTSKVEDHFSHKEGQWLKSNTEKHQDGQRPNVNERHVNERHDYQNGGQRPKRFTAKSHKTAELFFERLIKKDQNESSPNKHGNLSLETIWKSDAGVEIFLEKIMQKIRNKSSHAKHKTIKTRQKRSHRFGPSWLRVQNTQSKRSKRDSMPQKNIRIQKTLKLKSPLSLQNDNQISRMQMKIAHNRKQTNKIFSKQFKRTPNTNKYQHQTPITMNHKQPKPQHSKKTIQNNKQHNAIYKKQLKRAPNNKRYQRENLFKINQELQRHNSRITNQHKQLPPFVRTTSSYKNVNPFMHIQKDTKRNNPSIINQHGKRTAILNTITKSQNPFMRNQKQSKRQSSSATNQNKKRFKSVPKAVGSSSMKSKQRKQSNQTFRKSHKKLSNSPTDRIMLPKKQISKNNGPILAKNKGANTKRRMFTSYQIARSNVPIFPKHQTARTSHPIFPSKKITSHSDRSSKYSHPKPFRFPSIINNREPSKYDTIDEKITQSKSTSLYDKLNRRINMTKQKMAHLNGSKTPKPSKPVIDESQNAISKRTSLNRRHERQARAIKITSLNDDHPWLVEMHIPIHNSWLYRNCTGTLVSRTMVVASAHCFGGITELEDPEIDIVAVVMKDGLADIRHKFPKQMIIGEAYVQDAPDIVGDIALVEIYGIFGPRLVVAALPSDNGARDVNHLTDRKLVSCKVSALDADDYGKIHELDVISVSNKECKAGYINWINDRVGYADISDTELFRRANYYIKDKVCVAVSNAFCDQYFRGPLICNDPNSGVSVVHGVFSSQIGKCGAHPFVHLAFTAVQAHIDWINIHLGNIPSISSSILREETSQRIEQDVTPTKSSLVKATNQMTTQSLTNGLVSDNNNEMRGAFDGGNIKQEGQNQVGNSTEQNIADYEHSLSPLETLTVSHEKAISTEQSTQDNQENSEAGFENMENQKFDHQNSTTKKSDKTNTTESVNSEVKEKDITQQITNFEKEEVVVTDHENKAYDEGEIKGDAQIDVTKHTKDDDISHLETILTEDRNIETNGTRSFKNQTLHVPNDSSEKLEDNYTEMKDDESTSVKEGSHSNNYQPQIITDGKNVSDVSTDNHNEIKNEIEKKEATERNYMLQHFQVTLDAIKDRIVKGDVVLRDANESITFLQGRINAMNVNLVHTKGKQRYDRDMITKLQDTLNYIKDAIQKVEEENQDERDMVNDMQDTLSDESDLMHDVKDIKDGIKNVKVAQQDEQDSIHDLQGTIVEMKDEIGKLDIKLEEEGNLITDFQGTLDDIIDEIVKGAGSKQVKDEIETTKDKDKGTHDRSGLNPGRLTGQANTPGKKGIMKNMPGFDESNEGIEETMDPEDEMLKAEAITDNSGSVRCAGVVVIVMCLVVNLFI